jgi:hypothetical protein
VWKQDRWVDLEVEHREIAPIRGQEVGSHAIRSGLFEDVRQMHDDGPRR